MKKKIVAKIDSIILILIDFKTEISKKNPISKSFLVQVYNQSNNNKKFNNYNEV